MHVNQQSMADVLTRRACASRDTDAVMQVLAVADAGLLAIMFTPNVPGHRHMIRAFDLAGGRVRA